MCPASASSKIWRVVEIVSDNLKRVVMSKIAGNEENASGVSISTALIASRIETEMFIASNQGVVNRIFQEMIHTAKIPVLKLSCTPTMWGCIVAVGGGYTNNF